MRSAHPTYLRPLLIGVAGWLICTAALRWAPMPIRFGTRLTPATLGLVCADCAFFAALAYLIARRLPAAERFARLAAIVLPVVFGDAVAMAFFKEFFPRLHPEESGMFAAFLLLTTAVILATGLCAGSLRGDPVGREPGVDRSRQ
ncbi:MAG TPA: DUF5367 family protein [Steroidobacteraceae bacterium]|nr:DUF5367 family protein [Steroidobacteraceae bacterium]